MQTSQEHTDSWYAASCGAIARHPQLNSDIATDVCIIGAGYTGLSCALHLRSLGFDVVVVEANRVGWGASGRNGGHVGTGQRMAQDELEALLGFETAKQLWQLGLDAVTLVETLCADHGIDCELGRGNLHLASKPSHAQALYEEVTHLQARYGYSEVDYLEPEQVSELSSAQRVHGASLDKGARHLHPLKYALGLADAATAKGAVIYEQSAALSVSDDAHPLVRTALGSVKARIVVFACNGYLGNLEPTIAGNIMPINNFIVATEPLAPDLQRRLNRDRLSLSDSLFVINYWKLSQDGRLLFGGGENYSARFPIDIKRFVRPYLLSIYPELDQIKLDYGWGGTLAITLNRLPDFGRLGINRYYAQGFSGHGVPTATMAGKLIAEAINGNADDFDLMASLPTRRFPGGTLLRWPGLVAGMLFYSLRDKLGS